jgi:adenosine deaminase
LIFGNSLADEYAALAEEASFTKRELAQVARNGWEVADVSAVTRQSVIAEIERLANL